MFDYSKLRGLMAEKRLTQRALASVVGISENSFSHKINGSIDFTPKEILKLSNYMGIPNTELGVYFFTLKV